jgi:hypothetical protein
VQDETAAGFDRTTLEHLDAAGARRQLDQVRPADDFELHQQIRKAHIECRMVHDDAHRAFRGVRTHVNDATGKSLVTHGRHGDQHLAIEIATLGSSSLALSGTRSPGTGGA